jgi:hypothetical protein
LGKTKQEFYTDSKNRYGKLKPDMVKLKTFGVSYDLDRQRSMLAWYDPLTVPWKVFPP